MAQSCCVWFLMLALTVKETVSVTNLNDTFACVEHLISVGLLPKLNATETSSVNSTMPSRSSISTKPLTSLISVRPSVSLISTKPSMALISAAPSISSILNRSTTTVQASASNETEMCRRLIFGNWTGNDTFPFWNLPYYATRAPTTKTPTTLSPEQIRVLKCRELSGYMPVVDGCYDALVGSCAHDIIEELNEYLFCIDVASNKQPSELLEVQPMVVLSAMEKLGLQLAEVFAEHRDELLDIEFLKMKRYILDKLIYIAGVEWRYHDMTWPDYHRTEFKTDNKWNQRNDTITVPYITIPRGLFKFQVALYDNLWTTTPLLKEQVRIKDKWELPKVQSVKPPILAGAYLDYMLDGNLQYNPSWEINSAIISLSLGSEVDYPLPGDVEVVFTHKKEKMSTPICVYWQFLKTDRPDALPSDGYWTNFGMTVYKTNASMTHCVSTHLSSFALIMEPTPMTPEPSTDINAIALVLITLASVLILIAYVVAMFMLRCVRTHYSRMYVSIALSCLFSQLVFLFAMTVRDSWESCTSMAVIMELCHTAVMSWMMLESVHQLSRLRYFFNDHTNITAFYNITGWGFPIAVVIALRGFPYEKFEKLRFCWLYASGMDMWFFCGPLAILFLVNFIIRWITYMEIQKDPSKIEKDINYTRAWRSLIASSVVLPTFAVLWVVGTFGVRKSGTLQTILMLCLPALNIVVAFQIVYFYFYCNDEVADAILEQMRIREKKKVMRYDHLRGINMKVAYVPDAEDTKQGDPNVNIPPKQPHRTTVDKVDDASAFTKVSTTTKKTKKVSDSGGSSTSESGSQVALLKTR